MRNYWKKRGLGTKFDVLRAQVDLANAEQTLILAFSNEKDSPTAIGRTLEFGTTGKFSLLPILLK